MGVERPFFGGLTGAVMSLTPCPSWSPFFMNPAQDTEKGGGRAAPFPESLVWGYLPASLDQFFVPSRLD